ncbi:helix-turn-helix domain-containing protein [Bacillus sp. ISL-75]|uniref:helix-turn-helix domain-containing protein n=1 Tax=Bacillus sp. ISL-75 TaxID=2819137 RepID=UPI0027E0E44B|nr:helix-turn-helix domain-containing protein [Bacillus sp. ISL-75]
MYTATQKCQLCHFSEPLRTDFRATSAMASATSCIMNLHNSVQIHYTGGFFVIKYREILRLNDQGLSNRSIASSCGCSRNTVNNVIKRADELQVSWPLEKDITDTDLQNVLYPEKGKSDLRKQPDCCEILVCIVNQY